MKSISRALDGWISFCWRKWSKRKLSPIVSPPPPFSIIVQDPFINVKFQMVTDKQLLENWNKRDRGNLGTQRCANERLRDNGPTRNVTMMLLRSVTSRKSRKFLFTVQEGKTYDKKCHWLIYGRWQLIIRHLIKFYFRLQMKCAFIFYCIIFNLLVVKSRTSKSLQKSQSYCNYLKRLLKIGVCPEIFISKKISWTTIKMTVLFTRWSGRSVETEKLWSRIQENETDSTLLMNNWNVMKNKGGFYPLATERNNLRIKSEKNNLLSILLWITSLIPGNKCPHTRKVSNCCVIEKLSRRCHSILLPSSWVVT